jgi:hypothetical protein
MLKQKIIIVSLIFLLLVPASLFAWGSATHAYYAKHLGSNKGYLNLQEMYGAMVPDMFNIMFGSPYFDYLWSQSHEKIQKVMKCAITSNTKAFALGYASHNDVWGADYTAHHHGCTTPGIGYVEAQIENLAPTFEAAIVQILLDNNIDPQQANEWANQFAPSVTHGAVETAVDILIKRNEDPAIGARIIAASRFRASSIPLLLVAAYADDFAKEFGLNFIAASGIIVGAEAGFREFASYYGYMFTKNETALIQLLSAYGAGLAQLFMKATTGSDITVPKKAMADILTYTIGAVESSYAGEVAATLAYLENEMPFHGIDLHSQTVAVNNEPVTEIEAGSMPHRFSLSQNFPNPFNPTTTINYSLANDSHVKITVYNTLGQVVAVLVDEWQSSGSRAVMWDARDQQSGLYIYKLEADGFTASKKMFLQK